MTGGPSAQGGAAGWRRWLCRRRTLLVPAYVFRRRTAAVEAVRPKGSLGRFIVEFICSYGCRALAGMVAVWVMLVAAVHVAGFLTGSFLLVASIAAGLTVALYSVVWLMVVATWWYPGISRFFSYESVSEYLIVHAGWRKDRCETIGLHIGSGFDVARAVGNRHVVDDLIDGIDRLCALNFLEKKATFVKAITQRGKLVEHLGLQKRCPRTVTEILALISTEAALPAALAPRFAREGLLERRVGMTRLYEAPLSDVCRVRAHFLKRRASRRGGDHLDPTSDSPEQAEAVTTHAL